jgi:RNA polymerase sigma-70 factor (ECF subfamily)
MAPLSSTPRKGTDLTTTYQQRLVRVALPEANGKLAAEEHALVNASQRGDRHAFAHLVERYWESLYRWLYHLTHNRHTAEDLVQETFLKAYRGLNRFQAGSNFRAWLFRIAHNSFANQRRTASRIRYTLPENVPANSEGPVEQALSRESLTMLARAVNRLPADFRAAFLLRAEEGLSFRDIAEALGLTEETARWRVFKARQKLLSVLAPQLEMKPEPRISKSESNSKDQ